MSKPVVLGLVSFRIFPTEMGGQKFVADYYSAVQHEVELTLCVSKDNAMPNNGIDTYPILYHHRRSFLNIFLIPRLVQLIREKNIELVLIDHSYFGWIGMLLKLLTKKPYIIKSANLEYQRFKELYKYWWKMYRWYEKIVHQYAAHSFFITTAEKEKAISLFRLNNEKTSVLPYPAPVATPPTQEAKTAAKKLLCSRYQIAENTLLIYFNGTLDYPPNASAINWIMHQLIPELNRRTNQYLLIITGNRALPHQLDTFKQIPEIKYEGYVPDTTPFHLGTDCFICPVESTTGIKTKMVDALAYGQPIVCTPASASGFDALESREQFIVVGKTDVNAFATAIATIRSNNYFTTPASFYEKHHPTHIVAESLLSLANAAKA